jgi:enamine deaminase RidA (YjgF/YER057c/UK114 family)
MGAARRTAVNPTTWSLDFGFNQGELIEGAQRVLVCAGQTSVDDAGRALHPGDMASQVATVLDNLESVLVAAGMSLADLVRVTIFTTDVDLLLEHHHLIEARFERAGGVRPPSTLLGVARLADPDLLVEIQATAMR